MSAALAAHRQIRLVVTSSYLRPATETRWGASALRHKPTVLNTRIALHARYASIPPTQFPHSKPPDDNGLPPADPPRKPKVGLRPSPKIPESSSARTGVPSSSAARPSVPPFPPNTAPSTSEQVSPNSQTSQPEKPLRSAIDAAIADIQQAARSGDLAPPAPDATKVGKVLHYMWELSKFYYRGFKSLLANRRIVRQIQARVREEGREMTWREKRFVDVYRSDRFKAVPFLITCLILEEIIPLIVIYAPFLLPSTCILASQQARMESARLERQRRAFAQLKSALAEDQKIKTATLNQLSSDVVYGLCGVLSLSTFGPSVILRSRLRSALDRLAIEDKLLLGMLPRLDVYELQQAVNERGGVSGKMSEEKLRAWLGRWFEVVDRDGDASELEQRRFRALLMNAVSS